MSVFIYNTNSGEAEAGEADNSVMAWMIALFIAGKDRQSFFSLDKKPKDIHTVAKIQPAEIDMDELTQTEEPNSWLVY